METKPAGSCLSEVEWQRHALLARHSSSYGEPHLVEEEHGRVRVTWCLEEGREARLERLVMLDPDAAGSVRWESWLRDGVVKRHHGVPRIAAPLVFVAAIVVGVVTRDTVAQWLAILVAGALAALLTLPLVRRTRRRWREQRFHDAYDSAREREQAAQALVAVHAAAWRGGDRVARDAAARRLWEALEPSRLDAPR